MNNLIDQFLCTLGLLFSPFVVLVAVLSLALGGYLHRKVKSRTIFVLTGLDAIFFFAWTSYAVFPYPPGDRVSKWVIRGYEYTDAGAILAESDSLRGYGWSRKSSELMFASGGDPQRVWTGSSIDIVQYCGQLICAFLAFCLGALTMTFSKKNA